MTRYSKIYKTYFSPEFLKQGKKYRHLKKLLADKIKLLSENPYTHCKSELLVGELKGLRSARITKSFRVIFSVWEDQDGSFAHLKGLLQIHRGLKSDLKNKIVLEILQNRPTNL